MRGGFVVTSVVAMLLAVVPASAELVLVDVEDTPDQDPLPLLRWVHEIGLQPPFPDCQVVECTCQLTDQTACPDPGDDPGIPNVQVNITNMCQVWREELYYVSDPETSLSNFDGFINGEEAFRIDNVGINVPLISESMSPDGVFEPGETWSFIIQDYTNALGILACNLASAGMVGAASGGDPSLSSGSIITPEPGSIALLALGGLAVLIRRRRS